MIGKNRELPRGELKHKPDGKGHFKGKGIRKKKEEERRKQVRKARLADQDDGQKKETLAKETADKETIKEIDKETPIPPPKDPVALREAAKSIRPPAKEQDRARMHREVGAP